MISKTFGSLQHGTTAKDMLQKYKLIDCHYQRTNLGQLDCSSKLSLRNESFTYPIVRKIAFKFTLKTLNLHLK